MAGSSNDNDHAPAKDGNRAPDASGQAALLLVESLLHALIARSLVSVVEAIEVVQVARTVKVEMAEEAGEARNSMLRSLEMLRAIETSLAGDVSGIAPMA